MQYVFVAINFGTCGFIDFKGKNLFVVCSAVNQGLCLDVSLSDNECIIIVDTTQT